MIAVLGLIAGVIVGGEDREAGAVSFRYRDGSQHNGVPVSQAIEEIAGWIAGRSNVDPTPDAF